MRWLNSVRRPFPSADESTELQASNDQAGQYDTASEPAASVGSSEATDTGGEAREPGSGTSNRAFTETYGENVIPKGAGVDTTQLLDNTRAAIRNGSVDPYRVLNRTRANGVANAEEYAADAAEHERLVNEAVAK